jgi:hypothetical protein
VRQAQGFDDLGYRYRFDSFATAEHLTLAANDQFAPAARFLGNHRVNRNPRHVTYVRNPTMDFARDGTRADHAYWLSGIRLRSATGAAPLGTVDAVSRGFRRGDPRARPTATGSGTHEGGSLGPLAYTERSRAWGRAPRARRANVLRLRLTNVRRVVVHPRRARLTCAARVRVRTDGPARVRLAGCGRTVRVG